MTSARCSLELPFSRLGSSFADELPTMDLADTTHPASRSFALSSQMRVSGKTILLMSMALAGKLIAVNLWRWQDGAAWSS